MEEVNEDGKRLEFASPPLRAHRGLVVAAVHNDGMALRHAHEKLKGDSLVAYQAVRTSSGSALPFAPARVHLDRALALELVQQDGLALQHLAARWQDDYEIAMAAVTQNGFAFRFSSVALRANRELVATAVESHGRNLCYVSDQQLRSDHDLLLRCISKNSWALQYASDSVRLDRDFLLRAVEANGWALRFALAPYNTNRTLTLIAAKQGACALPRCSQSRTRAAAMVEAPRSAPPQGKGGHDALMTEPAVSSTSSLDAPSSPGRAEVLRRYAIKPPTTPRERGMPPQVSQLLTSPESRIDPTSDRTEWYLLPPHDGPDAGPTLQEYRMGVRAPHAVRQIL